MAGIDERVTILEQQMIEMQQLLDATMRVQEEELSKKKNKTHLTDNEKEQYQKIKSHFCGNGKNPTSIQNER